MLLCYPQACNTATLFFPTGHRGGGRKEGALHGSSFPITQRTPGHVVQSVAQEGTVPQSLEPPPEPRIIRQPRGMTSPDQRSLWLRLQPDSCLGKAIRQYEAAVNFLHWALWLGFLSINLAASNDISQHPINKLSLALLVAGELKQSEVEIRTSPWMLSDVLRQFFPGYTALYCSQSEHSPPVACGGNKAEQLIPGTKTPGIKALKTTVSLKGLAQFTQQN